MSAEEDRPKKLVVRSSLHAGTITVTNLAKKVGSDDWQQRI